MYNKILKIFDVKLEEVRIVGLTFLFTLLVGAVLNFMYSIPMAMFLARYNSSLLPYIYICAGISTAGFGVFFAYLEKRLSVFRLLTITLTILAGSLFVFWGVLIATDIKWISFALVIWAWMVNLILAAIYGILINQIFTLQQGKRLFGLMGGGIALGGIFSGFATDYLVGLIGTSNVILLNSLILLSCFFIQFSIKKHSGTRLTKSENVEEIQEKTSFKNLQNKRFVFSIFIISSVIIFQYYVFDLLFNTEIQKHFPNEQEMAGFYGVIYAIYDIFALITGFFLYGWVLRKGGLIFALALLPLSMCIFIGITFFASIIPAAAGLVFGLLVTAAIIENTSRESIYAESVLLLFQPLKANQRAFAQMQNELKIMPLATALIGVILVLIDHYFKISIPTLALIIFGISSVSVCVIFLIKKGYIKALVQALSKRNLLNPEFKKLDKDSLNILKQHLKSKFPEEIVYILQTIEKIDREEFIKTIEETLNHPLSEVRKYALKKIEEYDIKSAKEKVKQLCLEEKDPEVLIRAILAFAKIGDLESLSSLSAFEKNPNKKIATAAITAFIKYGKAEVKQKAIELVMQGAKSSQGEARAFSRAIA